MDDKLDTKYWRGVIKHYFKAGFTAAETHIQMQKVYSEQSPSYSTVKYWFRNFKTGHFSTDDDPRSGRPSDPIPKQKLEKIANFILANRKMSVQSISAELKLPYTTTYHCILNEVGYKKVNARWVPSILMEAQKAARIENARDILSTWADHWDELKGRMITSNET